jgi:hypothetical protein
MWSKCPCDINTVCWYTEGCGQRPMSRASLHLGSIKQVSCRRQMDSQSLVRAEQLSTIAAMLLNVSVLAYLSSY